MSQRLVRRTLIVAVATVILLSIVRVLRNKERICYTSSSPDNKMTLVVVECAPPLTRESPFVYELTIRDAAKGNDLAGAKFVFENDSAKVEEWQAIWTPGSLLVKGDSRPVARGGFSGDQQQWTPASFDVP